MDIRQFHVLPLTRAQMPLGMETTRRALAAGTLYGAPIGQYQAQSTRDRAADALPPESLVQQIPEPRGRVAQSLEDRHIRDIG